MPHYNETYSGTFIDMDDPSVDDIHINDIAHHLAGIGRANGGFSEFTSIAEHSVLVYMLARSAGADPKMQLAALMHDAHEAYLGDITRPAAGAINVLAKFNIIEHIKARFDIAICRKFGIDYDDLKSPTVRQWDNLALAIEVHWMLPSRGKGDQWERLPQPTSEQLARYRPVGHNSKMAKLYFLSKFEKCRDAMS